MPNYHRIKLGNNKSIRVIRMIVGVKIRRERSHAQTGFAVAGLAPPHMKGRCDQQAIIPRVIKIGQYSLYRNRRFVRIPGPILKKDHTIRNPHKHHHFFETIGFPFVNINESPAAPAHVA